MYNTRIRQAAENTYISNNISKPTANGSNNVYANEDGTVYRQNPSGGWEQQNNNGKWNSTNNADKASPGGKRPTPDGSASSVGGFPVNRWWGFSQAVAPMPSSMVAHAPYAWNAIVLPQAKH